MDTEILKIENISDLLKHWGFENLIDKFIENEIDIKFLPNLNDDFLKELIPVIGVRFRFSEKLQEYLNILKAQVVLQDNEVLSEASLASTSTLTSSNNFSTGSDLILEEIDTDSLQPFDLQRKVFHNEEEFNLLLNPVQFLNLNQILENSYTGKCVKSFYEAHQYLSRQCRSQLVDLIIKYLFNYRCRFTNDQFDIIANKIIEQFPKEQKQVYYVPPIKKINSKEGKAGVAKGKLVDRYRNARTKLRQAGLISKSTSTSDVETSENILAESDDIKLSKHWLNTRSDPWEDLLLHWRKTFSLRRASKTHAVHEFLEEWPSLKNEKGYVLIDLDFEELYPNKGIVTFEIWNDFFEKILEFKNKNLNETARIQEYTNKLQENLSENTRICIQLKLLSYLLPPKGRTRRGKDHWKPSTIECEESILIHAQIPAKVEEIVNERKNIKSQVGQPIQPYIIVEGNTLDSINQAYVIADNVRYNFNSVLRSLEVCFKLFHVTNACYPPESEHIWSLIQLCLFQFKTVWDKPIPHIMDTVAIFNVNTDLDK